MRAVASVPPPAPQGTMKVIGLFGHAPCAPTIAGAAMLAAAPARTPRLVILLI